MRGLAPIARKLVADRPLDVVSAESDRILHLIRAESGDPLVLEIEVLHWLVLKNSFEILLKGRCTSRPDFGQSVRFEGEFDRNSFELTTDLTEI